MTVEKIRVDFEGILNCRFGGNWHRFLEIGKPLVAYAYMNEGGECAFVRLDHIDRSLSFVFTDGKSKKVEFEADLRNPPYSRFVAIRKLKEGELL